MREIKFRAWDINQKKMFEDFLEITKESLYVHADLQNSNDLEIMQYTGMKAKGVEIYEGDIVELGHVNLRAKIIYEHCGFVMEHFKESHRKMYCANNLSEPIFQNCEISLRVIGNIYENPELLK